MKILGQEDYLLDNQEDDRVYTICDICGKVHDDDGNLVNEPKGNYNFKEEICWDCREGR